MGGKKSKNRDEDSKLTREMRDKKGGEEKNGKKKEEKGRKKNQKKRKTAKN